MIGRMIYIPVCMYVVFDLFISFSLAIVLYIVQCILVYIKYYCIFKARFLLEITFTGAYIVLCNVTNILQCGGVPKRALRDKN